MRAKLQASALVGAIIFLSTCTKTEAVEHCVCASEDAGVVTAASEKSAAAKPVRQEPTAGSPHVSALRVCDAKDLAPLDAARTYFDAGDFERALSCAAQASALAPSDVIAHTEHANALAALERFEEAKLAYARALAIDPESLDALAGAAHFYGEVLPSARDVDELGVLYADRGFDLATGLHSAEFAVEFAAIGAVTLNDVGRPADALERAEYVLSKHADSGDALYEKGLALFELCRFDEAKKVFTQLVKDPERAAHAHYHLGLILERDPKDTQAAAHFLKAKGDRPDDFPEPVMLSPEEFTAELQRAIKSLPDDMQKDLKGVPVVAEDLPALSDLTSGEPALSPTILGLFRGPSLGESCEGESNPCRSVAVYRKNLGRAVHTREELDEQVRVTLLHEIGHLRGEDDSELAARGLE